MSTSKHGYYVAPHDQPHPERTREILKAHPEVTSLLTRNPWTAALLLGIILMQTSIAAWIGLTDQPWWLMLIIAWCVGAFANHALYVIIHEATHNLIFRNRIANRFMGMLADLPNTFPAAMGFRTYHLKHHAHQGDYDQDADLASEWEARLIGNTVIGKALWQICFPIFQALRPPRLNIKFWDHWVIINLLMVAAFDFAIIWFFGWVAFLYFIASWSFSIGFHPLGARWIQEHYIVHDNQETYSYYGPINFLALNVGYHNEHHDFPSIPWNKLPELRKMAPEYYDTLHYHTSWTKLWLKFLFDPKLSLFSRARRA